MVDRICIITGANTGIGFETARLLLEDGARIGLVCRDLDKAHAAQMQLEKAVPGTRVDCFIADVSSLDSIRRVSTEIRNKYDSINVLVNNAGAVFARKRLSEDGVEMHLATNFLGHFLLSVLLLDKLVACSPGPGRIINLSSILHRTARFPVARLDFPFFYHLVPAYARSKLAIVLGTRALAARTRDLAVTVNCVDPGLTRTDIELGAGPIQQLFGRVVRPLAKSAAQAAEGVSFLASNGTLAGSTGDYFVGSKRAVPARRVRDAEMTKALWDWCTSWLSENEYDTFNVRLRDPISERDTTGR